MFTGHMDTLYSVVPVQISWPFYILDINFFSHCKYITLWLSFDAFNGLLIIQFLILMQSTESIFPLWLVLFLSYLISFPTSRSWSYSPTLSSHSVTFLHLGQKPKMYWLILDMVSEVQIKFYFFPQVNIQRTQH